MEFEQIAILLLGPTAVLLSQSVAWRRYACIVGLCGQIFWFYATWKAAQWGMFLSCFIYTWAWMVGVWNYWIKKEGKIVHQKDESAISQASS